MRSPLTTGRHAPVAAEDQARVIANILDDPAPHAGKVYPLYGPVEMTQEEIAHEVGEALGIKVKYEYVDIETLFEASKAALEPKNGHSARALYGALEDSREGQEAATFLKQHLKEVAIDHTNGIFAGTNDVVQRIGGVAGTTVREFVKQNRAAFDVKVKA